VTVLGRFRGGSCRLSVWDDDETTPPVAVAVSKQITDESPQLPKLGEGPDYSSPPFDQQLDGHRGAGSRPGFGREVVGESKIPTDFWKQQAWPLSPERDKRARSTSPSTVGANDQIGVPESNSSIGSTGSGVRGVLVSVR